MSDATGFVQCGSCWNTAGCWRLCCKTGQDWLDVEPFFDALAQGEQTGGAG